MSTFFKERIYPILFMAVLTAFFIASVASIHLLTRDAVKQNENLYLRRAVLFAAGLDVPEESSAINSLYLDRIKEVHENNDPEADISHFVVLDSQDREDGYVVFSSGPGLWGEITAVVGYEENAETLTGADFIKQNETPGLGARITEDWYKSQFKGKEGPFVLKPEGTADEKNEIDAITGATRTSEFVRNIINNSIEIVKKVKETQDIPNGESLREGNDG